MKGLTLALRHPATAVRLVRRHCSFSTDAEPLDIDIPWYNVLRWWPRSS